MLPVDAAWRNVTIEDEAREHEAGHAAAAHLLGFDVVEIFMDAKHGDWGKLGAVHSRWTGPIDDIEQLSFARAVVTAAGPIISDSWEHERSRGDRDKVEAVRFPTWSRDAWEYMVLDKTRRLRRTEPFRTLHYRIVKALERLGDFGTLAGPELRAVLDPPDADPLSGAPRPSHVATSARRRVMYSAAKVADAATGGLDSGPPDPSAVGAS